MGSLGEAGPPYEENNEISYCVVYNTDAQGVHWELYRTVKGVVQSIGTDFCIDYGDCRSLKKAHKKAEKAMLKEIYRKNRVTNLVEYYNPYGKRIK